MEIALTANGIFVDRLNTVGTESVADEQKELLTPPNSDQRTNSCGGASTFRCEKCDNFETPSRASLLLHVVQCLTSPSRLKLEEVDAENLSLNADSQNIIKQQSNSRKVFECDVCNMKFSNGANMRRHKMRHTGVKPYECRVCQKRFFRKDHLAEHFTTHTKTLPYHCPICNRGFQRQIAMRAHFQNEHVGQHDLVKSCPLCSYRAGSMKSLRIHFFNRHGIDLDNPGSGGPTSFLLALESQASQATAVAVAAFASNLKSSSISALANNSESGESLRSTENVTPPMHFLTPHVEISMPESADIFNENAKCSSSDAPNKKKHPCESRKELSPAPTHLPSLSQPTVSAPLEITLQNVECLPKNQPTSETTSPKNHNIKPSISLIPIKQEPSNDELLNDTTSNNNIESALTREEANIGGENSFSSPNSKLSSSIKVSPLKSLLREDLKRRICARANNRATRNNALENNNVIQQVITQNLTPINNSTPICNGTITSTGQETEALQSRKQILACLFCAIEFPDETLYFLHKGCHSESNPWKCNICGEQCNNVYEFNSHLLSKSHQ